MDDSKWYVYVLESETTGRYYYGSSIEPEFHSSGTLSKTTFLAVIIEKKTNTRAAIPIIAA